MQDSLLNGLTEREVTRVVANDESHSESNSRLIRLDSVAVEEPLEIRVGGETVAITMRTPGQDVALALGFLFSEGIIDSTADVDAITDSSDRSLFDGENIVDVRLRDENSDHMSRLKGARRGTLTTSACGVCGRKTIDELVDRCRAPLPAIQISANFIAKCVAGLRSSQLNFSQSGGVHAAAIFSPQGNILAVHEDVGRHNATDKAIGDLLQRHLLAAADANVTSDQLPALLVVSGRASFELVQKAAAAGIPILASVSAASSLAIDLAIATGLTLAGFVRGESFNIYAHPERIR